MVANRAPKFGGVRTGGRSARVVEQALEATLQLLGEVGYAALRFDEVAERSGVNKTTLYRRWPTKPQLVTAALNCFHDPAGAADTGDLQRDLTDMFVASVSRKEAHETRSLMRMLQAERNDPELEGVLAIARERVQGIRRIRIDAAVARGELPPHTDALLLLTLIGSAVYTRLLSFRDPPTPALIAEIVAVSLAGARAHYATGAAGSGSKTAARAPRRRRR